MDITIETQIESALRAFNESCAAGADPEERQALLCAAMVLTPHGKSSNTLEHGIDCATRYRQLIHDIESHSTDPLWPKWLQEHSKFLLDNQIDFEIISIYLTHHDCGKPGTMTIDKDGRMHFPGHAQASSKTWRQAGGGDLECELMAKDMVLHTASGEEAGVFAQDPLAMTLLLCAHVEIESNALSVFGGTNSTSYKIKTKALARRANAILANAFQTAA